jgi:hypothetical protein
MPPYKPHDRDQNDRHTDQLGKRPRHVEGLARMTQPGLSSVASLNQWAAVVWTTAAAIIT